MVTGQNRFSINQILIPKTVSINFSLDRFGIISLTIYKTLKKKIPFGYIYIYIYKSLYFKCFAANQINNSLTLGQSMLKIKIQ